MTARIGVSIAVFCGNKVLLVRRAKAPFAGLWSLPGGAVEPAETPAQAANRELFEETALRVERLQFVEWFKPHDRDGRPGVYELAVHGGLISEESGTAGSDADGLAWYALDRLPVAEMTPGASEVIRRVHAALARKP